MQNEITSLDDYQRAADRVYRLGQPTDEADKELLALTAVQVAIQRKIAEGETERWDLAEGLRARASEWRAGVLSKMPL